MGFFLKHVLLSSSHDIGYEKWKFKMGPSQTNFRTDGSIYTMYLTENMHKYYEQKARLEYTADIDEEHASFIALGRNRLSL